MTEITFEITKMWPASAPLYTASELVALYSVDVFPFKIHNGHIRKRPNGELLATLPGRRISGFSISSPELVDAIKQEALAIYEERFNGQR